MNEQIPTDLNGQVEYALRMMRKEDDAKGIPPWTDAEQKIYRQNIYTQFQERSPEYIQRVYGITPGAGAGANGNFSNSSGPKPDFSQPLQQTSAPLPPTTSFYELIQGIYGDKTDQELGNAQGYVNQNFPLNQTTGSRSDVPSTYSENLYRNFTPEQTQGQIPVVPTYTDKPAAYDSTQDAIYAGRGQTDMSRPLTQATYGQGIANLIKDIPDPNQAATYANPAEMIQGLTGAQRENFRQTGSRMTPEVLEGYLKNNNFQNFQPSSRGAFEQLNMQRQSPDQLEQQKYQDSLKILPSLVKNAFSQRPNYG